MSNYKHFKVNASTTLDDLTFQRNELAKEHHPDRGGTKEIMQEINSEFTIAVSLISSHQALGKIDSSGRQFLFDLIDGVAHLLKEAKKYPDWSVNMGVNVAKGIVNTIDTDKWTGYLIKIILKHQK